jgi:hypothetical protein
MGGRGGIPAVSPQPGDAGSSLGGFSIASVADPRVTKTATIGWAPLLYKRASGEDRDSSGVV